MNLDETGTSYTYDSNGNLISAKDNANKNQTYSYDSAQNLVSANYEDNTSYSYTYDTNGTNKHRLLTAKSNKSNILITYGYNNKGGIEKTTVSAAGTTKVIETTATYGVQIKMNCVPKQTLWAIQPPIPITRIKERLRL